MGENAGKSFLQNISEILFKLGNRVKSIYMIFVMNICFMLISVCRLLTEIEMFEVILYSILIGINVGLIFFFNQIKDTLFGIHQMIADVDKKMKPGSNSSFSEEKETIGTHVDNKLVFPSETTPGHNVTINIELHLMPINDLINLFNWGKEKNEIKFSKIVKVEILKRDLNLISDADLKVLDKWALAEEEYLLLKDIRNALETRKK